MSKSNEDIKKRKEFIQMGKNIIEDHGEISNSEGTESMSIEEFADEMMETVNSKEWKDYIKRMKLIA